MKSRWRSYVSLFIVIKVDTHMTALRGTDYTPNYHWGIWSTTIPNFILRLLNVILSIFWSIVPYIFNTVVILISYDIQALLLFWAV